MAKRRTASRSIIHMTAPRPVAPVIKVSAPRAAPVRHGKKKHHGGGRGGKGASDIQMAIAGFVVGLVEKQGLLNSIPSLPMIGKKGTAAVALHYFAKGKGGMIRDAKLALAVLSGYDLGKTGAILGAGGAAGQVAGVTSQV